jgi:hypothetical protein
MVIELSWMETKRFEHQMVQNLVLWLNVQKQIMRIYKRNVYNASNKGCSVTGKQPDTKQLASKDPWLILKYGLKLWEKKSLRNSF